MLFRIPIFYFGERQKGIAQLYTGAPLFFPNFASQNENLNRLTSKLARRLSEHLATLGKESRHDELANWSFNPLVSQHRIDLEIDLRRRRAKGRFFLVVFKHLQRRVAFSPTVPDQWFELNRNESLKDRATVVLSDYFRKRERDEPDIQPEEFGISGAAWVSTLELSVRPPQEFVKKAKSSFQFLGANEAADGNGELRRVGRCLDWLYPDELERCLLRESEVEELTRLLSLHDRRPVLLLGPPLVGKSCLIHEYVYSRVAQRSSPYRDRANLWLLSPQRLISGMSYVGQWEDRLLAILKEARKRDHILYFDDLLGLFLAGISASSTLSVAAVLKPYLERRELRVLGEITPEGFRVLQEQDRSFADLFHVLPLREPTETESLRILIGVQRQLEPRHLCNFDLDVLPTTIDLQRRYARHLAFPGKAARMLRQLAIKTEKGKATESEDETQKEPSTRARINLDTVLHEFQSSSGLSFEFLDQSSRLERETIRTALQSQVIGQDSALDAACDVIAIAKARLNDPDRPLASFLFLGPTGVGKTECAKAIASYLFGDAERLLRFDMNEYLEEGSAARLVGTFRQPEGLLTAAIRRQPFAVVLLDEIEKAHPEIFDLLLQVLGEGRLTDALGRTADFSNAIILLTSNLGVREAEGRFGLQDSENASAAIYVKTSERFFRPEFYNRLDRVIPFGRLQRDHVGRIAEKLIRQLLSREGFQQRKVLLHIDDDAREKIVDFGFDPVLGARALKRAIETQLTQPIANRLASTNVNSFTSISVYPGQATRLADLRIEVRELEAVPVLDRPETASNDPQRRLRRIQATFKEIEKSFTHLKPQGAITLGKVHPDVYRYFELRDRFRELYQQYEGLKDRSGGQRKMIPPSRPVKLSKLPLLSRLGMITSGPILREMASATSLNEYLQDLFDRNLGNVKENEFLELEQQLAVLQATSEANPDTDSRVLLYLRGSKASNPFWEPVRRLDWCYQNHFHPTLGVENESIPELKDDPRFRSQDEVMLVRGLTARRFCEFESGTHLFQIERVGLRAVQVFAYPLRETESPIERFWSEMERETEWKRTDRTGEPPFSFQDLIRVYSIPGVTLDFRTGMISTEQFNAEMIRGFILASLPIHWHEGEIDEESLSEEARKRSRKSRAEQFDEYD